MLMKATFSCSCQQQKNIVNISDWHEEFCQPKNLLASNDTHHFYQCDQCAQEWLIDKANLRNVAYAYKMESAKDWQNFDTTMLIKQQMLYNRQGYSDEMHCRKCENAAVNGSVYCLDHLFESGARV